MEGTLQFDGSSSKTFDIRKGVQQGCVLVPSFFGDILCLTPKKGPQHQQQKEFVYRSDQPADLVLVRTSV